MHAEPASVGLTLGRCEPFLLGDSCRGATWWLTSKGKTLRLSSNRS